MSNWRLVLRRLTQKIWFRAAIISVLAILLSLASAVLAPFIPYEFSLSIGSDAVDRILSILATSMLSVATFSLTAMVLAYSRAAQNINPRATQLLVEDKTAQNALSSFLGAFLFSIFGVIALSTGIYGSQGRVILYIGTILLVLWIVFILLRWISVLTRFGRVEDAIRRIEKAGIDAICEWRGEIVAQEAMPVPPPSDAVCIKASEIGYVTSVDVEACEKCAAVMDSRVHIVASPGTRVVEGDTLAWSPSALDEKAVRAIRNAFTIDPQRDFFRDPRFSMIVLSEIGSRALSPAINDPGTANAALDGGYRILDALSEKRQPSGVKDHAVLPSLSISDMVADLVLPLARDAASISEVGVHLQAMLGSLSRKVPKAQVSIRRFAKDALERARQSGMAATDLGRVERAHVEAFD